MEPNYYLPIAIALASIPVWALIKYRVVTGSAKLKDFLGEDLPNKLTIIASGVLLSCVVYAAAERTINRDYHAEMDRVIEQRKDDLAEKGLTAAA